MWVQTSRNVNIHKFQVAIFPYCFMIESHVGHAASPTGIVHAGVMLTWSKVKVKVKVTDSISANCAFLRLSPLPFWPVAQNWWLITSQISELVPQLAVTWLRSSWNVDITIIHWVLSALPAARSLWLWLQVGRNKPCMLVVMTVSPLMGLLYLEAGCCSWCPTNSVRVLKTKKWKKKSTLFS